MPADLPPHITVDVNEKGGLDTTCSVCQVTASTGPTFGGIPAATFSAGFVEQHRTHPVKKARRG